ncbi:hypothetical protein V8G54_016443 [Vigna mungo]|uniref:Uncharacterized protein n=1 Tax=Vigna mungo TaxID=3915 RepID=A0AAQ3S0G2_VIGMU
MADNTRLKTLSDKLDEMLSQMSIFSTQITDMHTRLSHLESPSSPPPSHSIAHTPSQRHFLKLDVPRFDGTDHVGWIFKITQFFYYHNTPEEERITVASFYLDGAALAWFQWMYRNDQILSWTHLLQALEARFAPTAFEDPRGKLFKLSQTSSVSTYLNEFEATANHVTGLSPPFLLSCFLFGFKSEIRREVLAQQPQTLSIAVGLAQLQEEKLGDFSRVQRVKPLSSWPSSSPTCTVPALIQQPPSKPIPPILPSPSLKTRYRQLTEAEMSDRRENGLCFNCDKKYSRSHRCPARFLLLIAEEDDSTSGLASDSPPLDPEPRLDEQPIQPIQLIDLLGFPAQISLHALSGTGAPEMLRLTGHIGQNQIRVLVDGGSSHNFIQREVATRLALTQSPTAFLKLTCTTVCSKVELVIQGHSFHIDLYVLDMRGSNIVLGAQWLKQLGPILMDYQALTMKFVFNHSIIELRGDSGQQPTSISLHQLRRVARSDPTAQIFSIEVRPASTHCSLPIHSDPKVQQLITSFSSLFSEPTSLPPSRGTDHAIPLFPNSHPVNVRPYKYPHSQKLEIENSSPFSSPVLLLKKKDGSWRMCVDYRALNVITIKDRFPLPTVDELLDELGSARCFSKLDLTSGFPNTRWSLRVLSDALRFVQRSRHIPIYYERHLQALVFEILEHNQFYLQPQKCSFFQSQISYLGHIVANGGVSPDPAKIQAMVQWPTPSCTKELRGFLGFTGFYRKFVRGYTAIAQPLTDLLKKGNFTWSSTAQQAFDKLKSAMTSTTVLSLPDFSKTFYVQTNASGSAMGAVLTQDNHLIAYFSKVFCPRLSKSLAYIRELHAITSAVKRWRQYLLGHFFIIQIDQRSLKELLTQIIQIPEQQHYLYKPGKLNIVADALSRSDDLTKGEMLMLTTPQFVFLRDLKESQSLDLDFILMRDKILSGPSSYPHFKRNEFHETPIGGHVGVNKTLKRLSANFYWKSMAKDVKQTKYSTKRPGGLLHPLPILTGVWEDISLDFVTGVPPSNGYTVLLVVVDRFSKAVHLGTLHSGFIAYKVVEFFVTLTEVINRTIEQYLRAFVHNKPNHWFKYLPWAEYHYNTSIHSWSGLTPFEVVYGKPPPSIPTYIEGISSNAGCDSLLTSREEIFALLKANLLKAQIRMKKLADSKRRDLKFEVGSWVYLKLQSYRQVSVSGHKYHKLVKRFYGPFKVLERIGPVAFKIVLPPQSKIHNVFHCSMLKHHKGPVPSSIDNLPLEFLENSPLVTPLAVLDFKTVPVDGVLTRFALVQWNGLSPDDTSWDKWQELKSLYDLEDKVLVEGDGIVMQDPMDEGARPKRLVKRPVGWSDFIHH